MPPDRRPRTISVTLEHFDQWFSYADEARRLFDLELMTHAARNQNTTDQ